MNLQTVIAFVQSQLANGNTARVFKAADAALATFQSTTHASDGDKAQAVADGVLAIVKPFAVVEPEIFALAALVEPYIGKLTDAIEFKFAPVAPPLDAQDGPAIDPPA